MGDREETVHALLGSPFCRRVRESHGKTHRALTCVTHNDFHTGNPREFLLNPTREQRRSEHIRWQFHKSTCKVLGLGVDNTLFPGSLLRTGGIERSK